MRPAKPARFILRYVPQSDEHVTVGTLEFDGDVWTFEYDPEYKSRAELRPIEGLDDLSKVHRSPVLFPFFAVRIPDTARADIRKRLKDDQVRDPDPVDLLRMFGRRVVSSPAFELLPV